MTGQRTSYLYITSEGLAPTVFDSQVLGPLQDLAREGIAFDLLIFTGWRGDRAAQEAERARVAEAARTLAPARVWMYGLPCRATRPGLWLSALLAAAHLVPAMLRGRIVCHCRGHVGSFVGRRLRLIVPRCSLVFDMRGDIHVEQSEWTRIAPVAPEEARAVRSACRILCVSEAFRDEVARRYPAVADRIVVIPCAADERLFRFDADVRERTRAELGLEDRQVLLYCGGLGLRWQLADEIVRTFGMWLDDRPDAHLLLITPDVELARGLCSSAGLDEHVTIVSARHADVPRYLMAGDVGLLLRRPDPVNVVASPTKLAEYLMTGLSVVVSTGVGDSDELVESNRFGSLVSDIDSWSEMQNAIADAAAMPSAGDGRRQRAERAAELLSSSAQIRKRLEVYQACSGERSG